MEMLCMEEAVDQLPLRKLGAWESKTPLHHVLLESCNQLFVSMAMKQECSVKVMSIDYTYSSTNTALDSSI